MYSKRSSETPMLGITLSLDITPIKSVMLHLLVIFDKRFEFNSIYECNAKIYVLSKDKIEGK